VSFVLLSLFSLSMLCPCYPLPTAVVIAVVVVVVVVVDAVVLTKVMNRVDPGSWGLHLFQS
jgi:hypothetical protein